MAAGFFKKLFGIQTPLEKLRSAVAQKNFAAAVHLAADLGAAGEPSTEVLELQTAAGDGLGISTWKKHGVVQKPDIGILPLSMCNWQALRPIPLH